MFADDAMYILSSRQELETLCAAIFHHMHHFGLLMHPGTLDENGNHQTKSKTEATFIPACPMTQEDISQASDTPFVNGPIAEFLGPFEFNEISQQILHGEFDIDSISDDIQLRAIVKAMAHSDPTNP
jgi:hypothetical protein